MLIDVLKKLIMVEKTYTYIYDYLITDNIFLKILYASIWIICIIFALPIIVIVLTILIFIDLLKIVMEVVMEEEIDDSNLFILYLRYITFYMTRKVYFEQFIKNNKFFVLLLAFIIDLILLPVELTILAVLIILSPIIIFFIIVLIICKYVIRNKEIYLTNYIDI